MRVASIFLGLSALTAAASVPRPDKDGKYTLEAEGIRAKFVPYGASLSNLFIKDKRGIERDIVMGFDNASYYSIDTSHPHLNGVPGRYANRIKNSTFHIDGHTYHTTPNEGKNTLHGGPDGWDWRNFTVESVTSNQIVFGLVDPAGKEGFPGKVTSRITYTLTANTWHIKMEAKSLTKKTPIMLSSHTYWNLDGFQNPNTPLVLNHTLSLPYSGQRVAVDGVLIPTGEIDVNKKGSTNDWWSEPKQIGRDLYDKQTEGNCGTGCRGYDTCYLVNRDQYGPFDWTTKGPVASLSSAWSGIKVDVFSDQEAYQVYSCNSQNGTFALKNTQGFFGKHARPRVVEQYGCVVMEVEDWIDIINNPAWQRDKRVVFGPNDPAYELNAIYKFSSDGY